MPGAIMQSLGRAFAALALALVPVAASAQSNLPRPVAAALAAAEIPSGAVAAWVQEIGGGRPLLAVNAGQPMNPASTIKLLTSYAALDLLGPAFTWKTEAWANGPARGDVLEGDLVLRGGGDPKLTLENFWLLLRGLRERGLREIRGELVLDHGYFERSEDDPARFDSEPLRPYNVSPDALLVNFKAVRFTFVPDAAQRTVRVVVEPRLAQLEIAQSPRLAAGPCNDWRAQLKADFPANDRAARVGFAGAYSESCGEKTWNVALLSHGAYVSGLFRHLWQELGGTITGAWRDGAASADARLLHAWESPPLADVVRDMNKFSNNVMARQLYLTLSAEILKQPGSGERSAEVVKKWLDGKNIRAEELVIENGSGLSRRERISAQSLGRVLLSAWQSPVMPEFVASLPLVAYDGTMQRRLRNDAVAGQAHIKTGSLAEVRTLAGYVDAANGRRYAVVFFINHANAAAGQPVQDAFLRWVHDGAGR